MRSIDDKLLCVISSCEDCLDSNKLVYYMYLFQITDYDFNFRYKITSDGLRSRGLNNYIDELLDNGYLEDGDGILRSTESAIDEVYDYLMTLSDIEHHNSIIASLKNLTLEDLHFLVITNMTINEVIKKYGIDGLANKNKYVKDIISQFSKEYSEENLNGAIKILKLIKRGYL